MNALTAYVDTARKALADERARSRLVRTDEADFLPAALEIVERPVSPTARTTARILLVGLVLTIAWLIFGRVDVVASAMGRLIPAGNVQVVQPSETAVVRAIHVRDGQRVRRGQLLVELDPTVASADAEQARKALETAQLDAARARAILGAFDGGGLNFIAPAGTSPEVAQTQRALAAARLAEIRAGTASHAADRTAALAAANEARLTARKLTETLPLLDQQLAANEAMLAKGYVSKLRVIEMRRQRLAAERDRDIAMETARKAGAQAASTGSGGAQSLAEARARILDDLAKAEADVRLRSEELTKATRRSSLQRLVSPVDGTVVNLAAHTIGGMVEAAKPVMQIVPAGGRLIAEVRVLNRDVGFVHPGQVVALKLEAFPFTRYGTVPGRVESVGADAVQDEKLGLVYTARVSLERDRPEGVATPLVPGMAVTADIRTGRRSLMSYLTSPIEEARHEAARER